MTTEQKIIRNKVGLLELAKQSGNVSQACKVFGYSRDSFYPSRIYMKPGASWPFRKSAGRSPARKIVSIRRSKKPYAGSRSTVLLLVSCEFLTS